MPKYLVNRDTWISHTGRLARAGEEVEFEPPVVLDEKGKPKLDGKGKPITMTISDNLTPLDEKPAKAEKAPA